MCLCGNAYLCVSGKHINSLCKMDLTETKSVTICKLHSFGPKLSPQNPIAFLFTVLFVFNWKPAKCGKKQCQILYEMLNERMNEWMNETSQKNYLFITILNHLISCFPFFFCFSFQCLRFVLHCIHMCLSLCLWRKLVHPDH